MDHLELELTQLSPAPLREELRRRIGRGIVASRWARVQVAAAVVILSAGAFLLMRKDEAASLPGHGSTSTKATSQPAARYATAKLVSTERTSASMSSAAAVPLTWRLAASEIVALGAVNGDGFQITQVLKGELNQSMLQTRGIIGGAEAAEAQAHGEALVLIEEFVDTHGHRAYRVWGSPSHSAPMGWIALGPDRVSTFHAGLYDHAFRQKKRTIDRASFMREVHEGLKIAGSVELLGKRFAENRSREGVARQFYWRALGTHADSTRALAVLRAGLAPERIEAATSQDAAYREAYLQAGCAQGLAWNGSAAALTALAEYWRRAARLADPTEVRRHQAQTLRVLAHSPALDLKAAVIFFTRVDGLITRTVRDDYEKSRSRVLARMNITAKTPIAPLGPVEKDAAPRPAPRRPR